jgi:hypothetical protein
VRRLVLLALQPLLLLPHGLLALLRLLPPQLALQPHLRLPRPGLRLSQ